MGIGLNSVHLISGVIDEIGDLEARKEKRVLTLGVQDCYFDYDTLVAFFQRHKIPFRQLPQDRIKLNDGFQYSEVLREKYAQNIHQDTLFEMLGFEPANIESMDVMELETPTHLHDLNHPVPEALHGRFDFVYDGGTCEHVFSMQGCFENMVRLVRVGGMVMHAAPADLYNHGFYNFSAEVFETTYRVNGFDVPFLKYVFIPFYNRKAMDSYYITYDWRSVYTALQPYFTMAVYGAFKKVEDKPFRIPIQGELRTDEEQATAVNFGEHGFPVGRFNRPGTLTGWLVKQIDKNWALSFMARGFQQLRKGHRVNL